MLLQFAVPLYQLDCLVNRHDEPLASYGKAIKKLGTAKSADRRLTRYSPLALLLLRAHPQGFEPIAESGPEQALLKKYGLTADDVEREGLALVGKK